jgi:hypothetical protein
MPTQEPMRGHSKFQLTQQWSLKSLKKKGFGFPLAHVKRNNKGTEALKGKTY